MTCTCNLTPIPAQVTPHIHVHVPHLTNMLHPLHQAHISNITSPHGCLGTSEVTSLPTITHTCTHIVPYCTGLQAAWYKPQQGPTSQGTGTIQSIQGTANPCKCFNYASCSHYDGTFTHRCWYPGCLGDHPCCSRVDFTPMPMKYLLSHLISSINVNPSIKQPDHLLSPAMSCCI